MTGCCNFCLTFVKEPEDYNRYITRLYCSQDCVEKDWLFKRWMDAEYERRLLKKGKNNDT